MPNFSQEEWERHVAMFQECAADATSDQKWQMMERPPIETMIPEIVAKNGVEGVESVGGATMSSDGIKAAVQDALAKAK